jgi:putative oxidoreductase
MNFLQTAMGFIGRACLSAIFIFAAMQKIWDWNGTEQMLSQALEQSLTLFHDIEWLRPLIEQMAIWSPVFLLIATAFELLGGILVLLGIKVKVGATLLLLFLIPATFFFHHFWVLEGAERELQSIMFMKNLSIFGGLLLLLTYGKDKKSSKPPAPKTA